MRVATDVGGTFTDLVYCDYDEATGQTGRIVAVKCDTTPPDFERGVMQAIELAGLPASDIAFFAHGTTVVINALTERKGAKVGLITTAGFRDALEIARGNRPDLFNFVFSKPAPFVPRHLRLEIGERMDHRGRVVAPFDPADLAPIVDHFRAENVEALAICFLHAYANATHEEQAEAEIQRLWPELGSVLSSHRITREWREYERTSTTVLSAYVHPLAQGYLRRLGRQLNATGVRCPVYIMQSNGGVATVRAAGANPINMVESGPASGMLGAIALGQIIGESDLIALDIGGTTAKCALIEKSRARITTDYKLEWSRTNAGYPIKVPVLDLVEIGAGGGSIAWMDPGGKLHVGPRSAGAVPGPAAFGRGGTEPTTTDANLITGRIDPDFILGGRIVPDMDNARRAFAALGQRIGTTVEETARGVIRVANANMVNALKLVSVNKGFDPREFTLMAFGGGGGSHACALARELGIPKVVVPVNAAVFSAWGMLMTDLRRDVVRTRVIGLQPGAAAAIAASYDELAAELAAQFAEDGVSAERLSLIRYADMRYVGQEHSVKIEFPDGRIDTHILARAAERFHVAHEREYSFRLESPVELVNYHLAGLLAVPKPGLPKLQNDERGLEQAVRGRRQVDFDEDGVHDTPIYARERMPVGILLGGPAVIEEPATTIVVPPDHSVEMDAYGNIHISIKERESKS
ncbi:MAG: hydantoinase/oxoprolinase family protein [Proteobacteria bacterium]|nr:hydantoinase/oxoprolinase family protein [Pseudomonadota bacterium]